MSSEELDSAILDALVESFALNRSFLIDEVIFEWDHAGATPSAEEVGAAVDGLLERSWLRETHEQDDGERYSVIRLTDEGKAEWRRRNPLDERLEKAWFAQGDFIYAPSEEIAENAAKYFREDLGLGHAYVSPKSVVPWTYELEDSGDVIHGVRVEYLAVRGVRELLRELLGTGLILLRLRLAAWRRSPRR